jgi:plasmid maintenance system antidote protein VapI
MHGAHLHLSFSLLQDRLLAHIRLRLFNGELTERRLARMIGVSQPHIHNVLKGVRSLTPEVADLLLSGLGLSVLDLLETREAGALIEDRQFSGDRAPMAPVTPTPLGPGYPFPRLSEAVEWQRLPSWLWERHRRLALAPLAPDPASPLPPAHRLALICFDEDARLGAGPAQPVVLRWQGAALVRRVRRQDGTLIVVEQQDLLAPQESTTIHLADLSPAAFVRAVVVWSGADFRGASPLDYVGSFLEKPASR